MLAVLAVAPASQAGKVVDRLVAGNSSTKTFTTLAEPGADAERAYELVSPPYKISGIGVGESYAGPGSLSDAGNAAYVGDRFAAAGSWGSMLLDSPFAFANDWAFAERVGDQAGWVSHSPITHPLVNRQPTRFINMQAATPDLAKVVWAGNGGQVPIFEQMASGWPDAAWSFATDWDGRWELFGPTDPGQVDAGAVLGQSLTVPALSGDGEHVVGSGPVRGMEGARDPTHPAIPALGHPGWPDLVAGRSVYDLDLSGGITDAFPVAGMRKLVNVCTGDGPQRTVIPSQTSAGGTLSGQTCPGALGGRDHRLISEHGASLIRGDNPTPGSSLANVVSSDGRRVFFMAPDPDVGGAGALSCAAALTGEATRCPAQLYVRERGFDGVVRTRWVSRAEDELFGSQAASLTGRVIFEGASEDGSRVFFRTNSPLTADDPNGVKDGSGNVVSPLPNGVTTGAASNDSWDLYMFELAPGPDGDSSTPDGDPTGPGSTLTRITAGPTGTADPNGLQSTSGPAAFSQGIMRFAADDGSRLYFAVSGQLPTVDAPADPDRLTAPGGDHTTPGQANLYAYDTNEASPADRWRFVARIPRAVDNGVAASLLALPACATTSVVRGASLMGSTPTGDIDFTGGGHSCVRGTSDGAFITFWTQGQLLDDGDDTDSADIYGYDLQADELARISAPQGGAGGTYPCGVVATGTSSVAAAVDCHGDGGLQSEASRLTANPFLGVVTDPLVAGDRIAFFQSRSSLVAEDTDSAYDVYQWRNGILSLVTTGVSDSDGAFYKGNDRTGRNVYFATLDSLTWQDVDAVADVYVARLGGGILKPEVPPLCLVLADACQGPAMNVPTATQIGSDVPSSNGNVLSGNRKTLRVSKLSAKARKKASRVGHFVVSVRTSKAGKVSAVAKGRIGKRTRRVASKSVRVHKAGKARLRLRLSPLAKRTLRMGKALKLTIQVRSPGARSRSMTVRLPGGRS